MAMLDNVSLTQLRAFAAVARKRNFTRAAADLDYTPPAIHHQVRSLEKALGLALITRNVTPVTLTDEGVALLPHVEALLYQAGQVGQAVRGLRAGGHVELGTAENAGTSIVMRLLSGQAGDLPAQVNLHVHEAATLVDLVRDGALDVAISARFKRHLRTPATRADLRLVRWTQDYLVLVEPARSVARDGDECVVFVPPYTDTSLVAGMLEGTPFAHRPLVHMLTGDAARSAARHGLGAAALPVSAVDADLTDGTLRNIAWFRPLPYHVYLLHRPPAGMAPTTRAFLRFLLDHRPRFAPPGGSRVPSAV